MAESAQWAHYGGDIGGVRYAASAEITPANVEHLQQAWVYRTGEKERRGEARFQRSSFQATPILLPAEAGGSLVFCTPFHRVVALDPATGEERWTYEPQVVEMKAPHRCRGVAYWSDATADETADAGSSCRHRVFVLTSDRRLIAMDARNGQACAQFGDGGTVSAAVDAKELFPGEIRSVSPPLVINDTVVVGSNLQDWVRLDAPPGTLLAFDARDGSRKWSFEPMGDNRQNTPHSDAQDDAPRPEIGHGNVWAPMSADLERNMVFVATSTPVDNFYGGYRPGDNHYANSTVALDADTGKVIWHFQVSHHDVWDYDLPAQPVLMELPDADGKQVPVVVQGTKQGMLFVFRRDTGEPWFPVEERPVPQGGVEGEQLSPTQPFAVKPPPLHPQTLTAEDAWGFTFIDRMICERRIRALRSDGLYTPVTEQGTVFYPSSLGGINWGGVAVDPVRKLAIANLSRVPMRVRAVRATQEGMEQAASKKTVGHETAFKPLFPLGLPYGFEMTFLDSPLGAPCSTPPWGTLVAVDLNDGSIKWEATLGTIEKLAPVPLPLKLGTPNLGGSIVTAGGLVFIGATMDDKFRAFDVESGKELWVQDLPAGAQATPMSYEINGRQFVLIAAGGHDILDTTRGDYLIAFALPR